MSEQHETSGSTWLTPTAAGIAALVVATLSLLGDGAWQFAIQGWLNRNGSSAFSDGVTLTGLAHGAVALCGLLLGSSALHSRVPAARNLGGAAIVVGILGLVVAGLTVLAGIAGM